MAYFLFQWNDQIVEHLAQNDVAPEDFEAVVCHPERKGFSRSSGRPAAWGSALDGRYLLAVYELLDDGVTVIPVTAYEVRRPRRRP